MEFPFSYSPSNVLAQSRGKREAGWGWGADKQANRQTAEKETDRQTDTQTKTESERARRAFEGLCMLCVSARARVCA